MADVMNTANISYTYAGAGADSTAESNTTSTTVQSACCLEITKMAMSSGFIPGDNVSFMLRILNAGTEALTGVVVEDNLGAYEDSGATIVPMSYVSGTAAQSTDHAEWVTVTPTQTNPLTFEIGALGVGEEVEITYTALVSGSFGGEEISNTASVSGEGSASTVVDSATSVLPKASYAQLSVEKTGSADTVVTGTPFTYSLSISNTGNADATGIVVTDQLPSNFVLSGINMIQNGTTTPIDATDYSVVDGLLTVPASGSSLSFVVAPEGSAANDGLVLEIVGQFN